MSTTQDFTKWHRGATSQRARTWNESTLRPPVDSTPETQSFAEGGAPSAGRLASLAYSVGEFWGRVVILDLILGFATIFSTTLVTGTMPGFVPVGLALVVVGAFRHARLRVSGGGLLFIASGLVLFYLIAETAHNHMPWSQRIAKIVILLFVAMTIATGRVNMRSLIIGGVLGAAVNIPAFYAGLTPNDYPPYLTGFYGDKNVAGMYYAMWGILGMIVLKSRKMQIAFGVVAVGVVFLTGSRTALGGILAAYAWIAFRNRVGVTFRVATAAIGYTLLSYAIAHWADNSAFGNRIGDDWYRHQVEAAMNAKAAITPWYGMGLNSGQVQMGSRTQWFHNSYLLGFVEGGYIWLGAILAVFVLLGLGLFDRRLHIPQPLLIAEGSTVSLLICAWKLGEVFVTMAGAITLGIAIAYRLGVDVRFNHLAWDADLNWRKRDDALGLQEATHGA